MNIYMIRLFTYFGVLILNYIFTYYFTYNTYLCSELIMVVSSVNMDEPSR